jgi:hypothetical protein
VLKLQRDAHERPRSPVKQFEVLVEGRAYSEGQPSALARER